MRAASTTLLLIVACNTGCHGLVNHHVRPDNYRLCPFYHHQSVLSTRNILRAIKEEGTLQDTITAADSKEEETTLLLRGEFSVSSADVPKTSIEDVDDFFRADANRDLLVTGGGERPCSESKATPKQLSDWKIRCSVLGATPPDENDPILSIVSRGIQFPGLKVESNALIGAKYVGIEDETMYGSDNPRYEFVLLKNEQIVSGLAPTVWIFKKLTGADKNGGDDGDDDSNTNFDSLSTVTYEENENGTIVFRTNAFLSIAVTFPKLLLKILPGDKATIEERGGKSIVKTLEKDVSLSMKSFEKAYLERFKF